MIKRILPSAAVAQRTAHAMACGLLRPLSLRCVTLSSHIRLTLNPNPANHYSTSFFNFNRPYPRASLNFHSRFPRCLAAAPGSPPPPDEDLVRSSSGLDAKFLRLKDTVRIFFAVLFWMSLFFWACVWDDKNAGNPTKGSHFRR